MAKTHFDFKKFTIYHDKCAMKVGTDGVLLGAWTEVCPDSKYILDIGTGSGLIAIMLAQKCNAYIIGIDIDEEAVNQATDNGEKTPWSQRLHFEVENALTYIPQKKFDLITCNPPFFTNSLRCPGEKRNYARHSGALPFDALIANAYTWLNDGACFNVVLPASSADAFIQMAWERGFNLHKRCMIHSLPESMPKRALLSFKKGSTPYPQTTRLMVRDRNGIYTEEYKKLTEEYYIHF